MISRVLVALLVLLSAKAYALSLGDLTNKDATSALKQALTQGATRAVDVLGKVDGFLGNPTVKIPLPENLQKVEGVMRRFGMGDYADELVTSMNRAAEAAVPEARALLVNSIKQMSVQDAKTILTCGDDAATQYFKRTASTPLAEKFGPIVQKAIAKVTLAEKYDEFAGKAASLNLIDQSDARLEPYVTAKAMGRIYAMIAEEEKKIRKEPMAAAGSLAKKVFGLLQ